MLHRLGAPNEELQEAQLALALLLQHRKQLKPLIQLPLQSMAQRLCDEATLCARAAASRGALKAGHGPAATRGCGSRLAGAARFHVTRHLAEEPSKLTKPSDELAGPGRHLGGERQGEAVARAVPLEVGAVDVLQHEEQLAHESPLTQLSCTTHLPCRALWWFRWGHARIAGSAWRGRGAV